MRKRNKFLALIQFEADNQKLYALSIQSIEKYIKDSKLESYEITDPTRKYLPRHSVAKLSIGIYKRY